MGMTIGLFIFAFIAGFLGKIGKLIGVFAFIGGLLFAYSSASESFSKFFSDEETSQVEQKKEPQPIMYKNNPYINNNK